MSIVTVNRFCSICFQKAVQQTLRPFTIYAATSLLVTTLHVTVSIYQVLVGQNLALRVIIRIAGLFHSRCLQIE